MQLKGEIISEYRFVSIITPNYNGKKLLDTCFSSIQKQNYPKDKIEVILVDDASTDDSVEFVKKKFPRIKIIKLKKNVGYVKACNEGYKLAKGEYIALLDNDTILPKDWLKPLVETLENDSNVAAATSMVFKSDIKNMEEKYGEKINLSPVCIGRSDPDKNNPFVLFPTGGFCLLRKKVFDELFDPDYIAYLEDAWLGWKAWLQGYKVIFNKNSKLVHLGSASYGFFSKRQVYLTERNRIMNIVSFFRWNTIFLLFSIFSIDFLFRIFYFLFSFRFDLINAEFSGMLWNILNIKLVLKKRKKIQKLRKVDDYIILEAFCENTYGEKTFIKRFLNYIFKKYFRFVKKTCKYFRI